MHSRASLLPLLPRTTSVVLAMDYRPGPRTGTRVPGLGLRPRGPGPARERGRPPAGGRIYDLDQFELLLRRETAWELPRGLLFSDHVPVDRAELLLRPHGEPANVLADESLHDRGGMRDPAAPVGVHLYRKLRAADPELHSRLRSISRSFSRSRRFSSSVSMRGCESIFFGGLSMRASKYLA